MKILKLLCLCVAFATSTAGAQQASDQNKSSKEATAEAAKLIRGLEKHLSGKSRLTYETQLTSDVVLENGQKIQIAGRTKVYFKRPNQLMVELETDSINRRIYHDGKQLTIIAPDEKYYGVIEADTSSIEALMRAAEDYGVEIPLIDLIAWGVKGTESLRVESAVYVGKTKLQGKSVDHWAFRGPKLDWEVWVTQGTDPLPLKISTVSYHSPSQPRFTATIKWNSRSSLIDSLFSPKLEDDFHQIPFKQLNPRQDGETKEKRNE